MHFIRSVSVGLLLLAFAGCDGKGRLSTGGPPPRAPEEEPNPVLPFEPVEIHRAAEKVKQVSAGLALTDEELTQVAQDPAALNALADAWVSSPEGMEKLQLFFTYAFQQKLITLADLVDQLGGQNTRADARMLANIQETFPRTALEFVKEQRPFNETMKTGVFMMTPALAALMATLDVRHVNDRERATDRMTAEFGVTALTIQSTTPVTIDETLNPASANFMSFYVPAIPTCPVSTTDPTPRTTRVITTNLTINLFNLLLGYVPDDPDRSMVGTNDCRGFRLPANPIADADYTTWRLVRIRTPNGAEKPTAPFALSTFRTATEIVLRVPRVGFFSTPSFFANWPTNDSNVARVTANQSLIVALGLSIESSDTTVPLSEPALDAEHAAPGSVCYGCHRTLDPMRQVFRRTYSLTYHEQTDATQLNTQSVFSYGGVSRPTNTISEYAAVLAEHPQFAVAWVRKYCHFVNSAECSPNDPEVARLSELFRSSGYNFKTLAKAMLTSPLTTGLARTQTHTDRGEVLTVSRRDHLCAKLANRLKIANPCTVSSQATRISATFPEDGYSRGSEVPLTISDTSLFYRSGVENLCVQLATRVVDATNSVYASTAARLDPSMSEMVSSLMGLPARDPRSGPALQILKDHYAAALAQTKKPSDSLRSTFVLACTSPAVLAVGL